MVALDLVVVCILLLRYPQLLSLSFDEEFARATGVRVDRLHFLLLCLVALTVVVLIRIVGIILVIALLTVPAMVSWQFTRVFHRMILAAIGLSAVFAVSGLWISYVLDLPSGAAIVLVASAGFFVSLGVKRLCGARRAAHAPASGDPSFQPHSFPDPENS